MDDEEHERQCREEETMYYNELINDGGRPSHPINLGYDVAKNLDEYREILSFWHTSPSDPYAWMVFSRQSGLWKLFREHQRYVREQGRFSAYCQRLHDRLARHGFERSFQLNKEPDRQDRLATWIEFLNYEYWKYDKSASVISRRQQRYDEAWKKLVDSKVLKPFETEDSFDFFFWLQQKNEETLAKEAVETATSAAKAAEKALLKAQFTSLPKRSLSQVEQKLFAARSRLTAATYLLEQFTRRDKLIRDFLGQTKSYRIAKDDVASQSILLRWILRQVPFIELELNPTKVTGNDLNGGNDGGRRRFKRNRADETNEERVSKQQREGDNLLSHRTRAFTDPTTSQDASTQLSPQIARHEGRLKRNYHNSTDEGRTPKRPRYSGQKTSTTAEPTSIGEPLFTQSDRSGPDNSVAQVSPKPRKRQPKVYKKERESRRIAGRLPQFGMLPKQGEPAPPYVPPSQYRLNARRPNFSSLRSHASSMKKSTAVKRAKPQQIPLRRESKHSKSLSRTSARHLRKSSRRTRSEYV